MMGVWVFRCMWKLAATGQGMQGCPRSGGTCNSKPAAWIYMLLCHCLRHHEHYSTLGCHHMQQPWTLHAPTVPCRSIFLHPHATLYMFGCTTITTGNVILKRHHTS
jgi:hypothetical protein